MADKAHYDIDKRLADMEKHLSEIYEESIKGIEDKAKAYFEQFQRLDDQKKRMVESGTLSEEEYATWRKNKMLYGKRFSQMKEQIARQLGDVNNVALAYINGELPAIYVSGYNALEDDTAGIKGYSFQIVDADTVRELATAEKIMLPYKKLDPAKDIPWNVKKVNTAVLQGILQGESIPKIAKRIAEETSAVNMTAAIRNARTMVTASENVGRMDGYRRAEKDGIIMQKRWIATKDSRVRHWHDDLDGQVKNIDEPFENVIQLSKTKFLPDRIMYPGDPNAHPANVYNCRCTIASKIIGFSNNEKSNTILTFNDKDGIMISDKQFGKKVGKHAIDYGLDPREKSSRNQIIGIIHQIVENADEIGIGFFRGQLEDVYFYIYDSDVVITNKNGEFVTLMKGGINNGRVKDARRKKI